MRRAWEVEIHTRKDTPKKNHTLIIAPQMIHLYFSVHILQKGNTPQVERRQANLHSQFGSHRVREDQRALRVLPLTVIYMQ